jgi:ceramide glucosyltransferase
MVKLLESLLIIGISINLLSAVLTRYRYSGKRQCEPAGFSTPIRITVLRPICGLEPFLEQNIRSTFMQRNEPQWLCDLDIYFCIDDPNDPALPIVHQVYDEFPDQLKLLIGNPWKQFSIDPKLNNLQKGFTKLTTEMIKNPRRAHFVCVVDSNIRLPPGYLLEMLGKKRPTLVWFVPHLLVQSHKDLAVG